MRNLHIFDVSGVVYYGTTGSAASNIANTFRKFPIGGIKTLMSRLAMALAENGDVLLAFDSRSFRKDLLDVYKGDRVPNRSVSAQLDFLYDQLAKAGVPVAKYDTYEADDIISWAVKDYVSAYDYITICSNDHDVAHNVQNKVIMKPFSRNDAIISAINFEYTVQKGKRIQFNTISAYKVFMGCSSDRIAVFKSAKYNSESLYRCFLNFLREHNLDGNYGATTDKKTLAIFINTSGLFTESEKEELYKRIDLVYPAEKPACISLRPVNKNMLDLSSIADILIMCRDRASVKNLGVAYFDLSDSFLHLLDSYSQSLNSGAYSVDRNLEVDPSYELDSATFFLKEF